MGDLHGLIASPIGLEASEGERTNHTHWTPPPFFLSMGVHLVWRVSIAKSCTALFIVAPVIRHRASKYPFIVHQSDPFMGYLTDPFMGYSTDPCMGHLSHP